MEPHVVLNSAVLRAFASQNAVFRVADAVFHLTGPGVVDCLQGVLTNDVIKPGANSLVWGGLLTPKGMIISDAWVRRLGAEAWVLVPGAARTTVQQLFARSFPPRLVSVRDATDTVAVLWMTGAAPAAMVAADLVRPHGSVAPFAALLLTEHPERDLGQLAAAGWPIAPPSWADAFKLIEGWPTLGREIDEKTLPQEVRFDELDGVKYDKGCYTGQETVARLHFRGHANRAVRGLRWNGENGPADAVVRTAEREIGTIRTLGRFGDDWLGLAMLRRDVVSGEVVEAGGQPATVVALPFEAVATESA